MLHKRPAVRSSSFSYTCQEFVSTLPREQPTSYIPYIRYKCQFTLESETSWSQMSFAPFQGALQNIAPSSQIGFLNTYPRWIIRCIMIIKNWQALKNVDVSSTYYQYEIRSKLKCKPRRNFFQNLKCFPSDILMFRDKAILIFAVIVLQNIAYT